MKPDIQIAQEADIRPIAEIAEKAGISEADLEFYGRYKAKVNPVAAAGPGKGKLILVTAITPTAAGEGKTTVAIGLADSLNRSGRKAVLAIREPSMGPVFGVKGGAAGGGYSQVIPMEDINLHFTGDMHAITAANNLLSAMIDNHIYQGNALNIDPDSVTWRRCLDVNDRQLRRIRSGMGGRTGGVERDDGFDITAASETMAIVCLAKSFDDLKLRLSRIVCGSTFDGKPVTAGELNAVGAMAAVLKDAVKPNLVQTLEGTPAFIHGGPFANIAHGCSSVMATEMALGYGDYVVTEAGFGADLGAEKFFDIKCRTAGIKPDAVVMVVTVRALKLHGGADAACLGTADAGALKAGLPNLMHHIKIIRETFGLPCVVAINRFSHDSAEETDMVKDACRAAGVSAVCCETWEKGSAGGAELAEEAARLCEEKADFRFAYDPSHGIKESINSVVRRVYGGNGAVFTPEAANEIERLTALGYGQLPVCISKTQYSLSDDKTKTGAPEGFDITIRNVKVSAGAGFIVALAGSVLTMPGLPKHPAAENIDVSGDGVITGLF